MLSLDRLTKRYGAQLAVDHLSLEIPAGQIVGLLGPNGAGKTTTLEMLSGLLHPDEGTARIAGFDIIQDALQAKRAFGFVPDSGAVYESLTGLEYLLMVAALYGIEEKVAVERVARFIEFFELGMDTLKGKLLGAYSKGMRRKVVITAALLH
ncbi:MAG: ABC transporter ATP-binding protein, partial [Verrucomicrobium sp.]